MNGSAAFVFIFWQSLCIAAFVSLIVSRYATSLFNPNFAVGLFFVCLICNVLFKRNSNSDRKVFRSADIQRDLTALCLLLFISIRSPRGDYQKFVTLLAEDNEGWTRAPLDLLRNSRIDLSFSLDTLSIQYFVNFSLGAFTRLFGNSPSQQISDQTNAIHAVANSWLFLLVSGVILVLFLTSDLVSRVFDHKRSFVVYVVVGLFQLGYFTASFLNGHFAQLLLNIVVLVLCYSLIEVMLVRHQKWSFIDALIALTVAFALVGSYNPWIAISIGSVGLIFVFYIRKNYLLRIVQSRFRFIYLLLLFLGSAFCYQELSTRYGMLDEAGGIWVVGMRSFIIYILILIYLSASLFIAKNPRLMKEVFQDDGSQNEFNEKLLILFFVLSIFLISEDLRYGQLHHLILLLGTVLTKRRFLDFQSSKIRIIYDRSYIPVILLCGGSGLFVVYVWIASVVSGPIYAPMYAAHKSLLAFSGQFYWLVLCFFFQNTKQRKFLANMRNLIVGIIFLSLAGIQPLLISQRYFESRATLENTWWIKTMINVYNDNSDATVICVNGEIQIDNFSVYNCNRFSSSLSQFGTPAAYARFLAWGQKEKLGLLIDSIKTIPVDRRIVILSFGPMTTETRAMLDVGRRNYEIVEIVI